VQSSEKHKIKIIRFSWFTDRTQLPDLFPNNEQYILQVERLIIFSLEYT